MKISKFSRDYAIFNTAQIAKLRLNPQNSRDRVAHGSSNTLCYVQDGEERKQLLQKAGDFLAQREVRIKTHTP